MAGFTCAIKSDGLFMAALKECIHTQSLFFIFKWPLINPGFLCLSNALGHYLGG